MSGVGDVEFLAGLSDNFGYGRVVYMRYRREEVVFDLKIHAAPYPCNDIGQHAFSGMIGTSKHLLLAPVALARRLSAQRVGLKSVVIRYDVDGVADALPSPVERHSSECCR